MPLFTKGNKHAFKKNISTEVKAGKPIKQAVAIAFAVKKKAAGSDNFKKAKNAAAQARPKKKKLTAFA